MPDVLLKDLQEGDLVRLTYKLESGNGRWYEWESTGIFIAVVGDTAAPVGQQEILVSYRPQAGTSRIPLEGFLGAQRLATRAERMSRRTSMRGDSQVSLPRRKKGAVPAP